MNIDIVHIGIHSDRLFKEGSVELISKALTTKSSIMKREKAFGYVCQGGNVDVVQLMISKGIYDYNSGLDGACRGGHIDIVKMMLEKVNKEKMWGVGWQWNYAFTYACEGGNIDIVKMMIDRGAHYFYNGFVIACEKGYMDIVELLISKGEKNWDAGFYCACKGGHMNIIELMISKGTKAFNWGFEGACTGGQLDIVKSMISKGGNSLDWDRGFFFAKREGHTNVCDFILSNRNLVVNPTDFPLFNKKTKYYHNDLYYKNNGMEVFGHRSIIYWTFVYCFYTKKKGKKIVIVIQKDLIPSLLKLLYF